MADVRMLMYGFQYLVDNRSVASCQQIFCKLSVNLNLLSTGLLQVVSTSCNKFENDKLQQA